MSEWPFYRHQTLDADANKVKNGSATAEHIDPYPKTTASITQAFRKPFAIDSLGDPERKRKSTH